jgi:hypothetical protein
MTKQTTLHFPPQKLSRNAKNKKWAKKCIDAAEDLAIFRYTGIRESYKNKLANYNLANDILDTGDIEKVCNPLGLSEATFPAKMQNYPIANPKIDLLVGEERKRRFNWQVRVTNDDAISQKEEEKKGQILQFLQEQITAEAFDEKDAEQKLQKLNKYLNFEWQDLRERTATHILNYLYKPLDLKDKFSRGFEDALIAGEEIYCADIEAGEPILRRVNPLNLHTVRTGESPYIEDSDIIVEDGYYSPGQVIDKYYDYLTPAEIKAIDENLTSHGDNDFISIGEREQSIMIDGVIDTDGATNKPYGEYYDTEGNLRVVRVVWRSLKKVGTLTYYDEEGLQQETIVSEEYKIDKDAGESIKWFWIGEWWEGTKIGKDIYVKIQPRPIQFRSMTNLSKCSSGYVGIAYNINSSKAKSLMDRMKPYQYLYNVFMYRTELAFAKAKGRIATMDLAMVPDHWDPEKWMYYAEIHGWAVKDSFKEAKKGAAQGKLAGQMQAQSPVLDLELGNYIQQHIMMLQFIENQLGKIAGVTEQRQGQIENRELVGNVERAVSQSSHITEKWFAIHNNVKRQAMSSLLETAKYAWRDAKDKRIQYVLDDMSTSMLALDGGQFNEADYGIILSDTANDQELISTLKQLAHAGIQNDKMDFSTLMDIYLDPSIASMRRKIEGKEAEKIQRDQEQMQQQQQMQQEQLAAQAEAQQAAQAFELEKLDREYEHKKDIELLKAESKLGEKVVDMDRDGIPDQLELEKNAANERVKEKEIQAKKEIEEKKLKHDAEQNERDRKNKIQLEKIKAKNKPKVAAK